jgi:hypothetical protein
MLVDDIAADLVLRVEVSTLGRYWDFRDLNLKFQPDV